MMKLLEGKVALITGAGCRIGKARAQVFVNQGAKVVVGDIKEEWIKGTADQINAKSLHNKLEKPLILYVNLGSK